MSLYTRAGEAFEAALQRDPLHVDALMGQGVLALALHDFHGALGWAEQARSLNPFRAGIVGIMVDAQVELGRYDGAVDSLQTMVDLRPDLQSYSRVSYLRELHGDVDGAIEAMQTAVTSTPTGTEDWRWTLTHLGHLYFNRGDLDTAATIYQEVLAQRADYPFALAGMARIDAAHGDSATAIIKYQDLVERLPLPEFVIALGELYEANGDLAAAQTQYGLVEVMQQLNAANGMNVDLEMATFTANHGKDITQAVTAARAAYAERPTIYAADTLAWALYRDGQYIEAARYSQEALRLDTADAMLHFHAGMIAAKLGEPEVAREHLEKALAINPYFSALDGPIVTKILAGL
jgi:tetratricopeptide (TPR) repeat protein